MSNIVTTEVGPDGMEIRTVRSPEQPGLVTFGRGRTVVYFKRDPEPGCSDRTVKEEGYDDPEDFFKASKWWAHSWMEKRDAAQFEGVPFVDLREAVATPAGYNQAIHGPMVDVDLPNGAATEFEGADPIMAAAMSGNFYGFLLKAAKEANGAGKRGPLDFVSVREYCALWMRAGAVVGTIRNGEFVGATLDIADNQNQNQKEKVS